ncbi:DUF6973 domain-containing protein [Leucobacter sp. NPDC058333]|uniref:DUF6973 domain-containing protein n=1 Tax=Leucobacter sp. NPDC058333 TaxID=3346450 RepID=UPI0036618BC9
MSGFFESRLEAIANAPRYGDDLAHASTKAMFEDAANAWTKAAADPGFTGKTGDAASASFARSASAIKEHIDQIALLPSVISDANAALDEAWNILDALPDTGPAEKALATAFSDAANGGSITTVAQVATAYSGVQAARAAREAAALTGYTRLIGQLGHVESTLQKILAALGFSGTDFGGGAGGTKKLSLDEILVKYQIKDDPRDGGKLRLWDPYGMPHVWAKWVFERFGLSFNTRLTAEEKDLLEHMAIWELKDAYNLQKTAQGVAEEHFPVGTGRPGNYDQNDAFRHTYWSAIMTKKFGAEWAEQFTSAHEGYRSNPGPPEAMDLYNNEFGRKIATEHPFASDEELAVLIEEAVRNGDVITIDADRNLQWSDYEGPHPGPDDFDEVGGTDSLPGRDRSDFGVDDRAHHPIPKSGTGTGYYYYWR